MISVKWYSLSYIYRDRTEFIMVPHITQSEFADKVENVPYPVLVDFFATWCGPCKMMAPVLDRVALAKQGKAAVYKVDVDQEPELAQRFGVMSVPTLIVFKDGSAARQFVGVQSEQTLVKALD